MDENNSTITTATATATATEPQTAGQPQTPPKEPAPAGNMTDGLLNDGGQIPVVPEGVDPELWDESTMTLKKDAVLERLKNKDAEIEKYKKQSLDMRRKLSKGVETPEKVEDYAADYVFDEKYDSTLADKDSDISKYVTSAMDEINKLAVENGFTLQQTKIVKDKFMQVMEDVSLIDTRSDDEKAKSRAAYIQEQKKLLGDDADNIIKSNANWVANYNFFEGPAKEFLSKALRDSAAGNLVVYQIRQLLRDKTTANNSIPTMPASDGLPSDEEYRKEWKEATPERRMRIIQERMAAGRERDLF